MGMARPEEEPSPAFYSRQRSPAVDPASSALVRAFYIGMRDVVLRQPFSALQREATSSQLAATVRFEKVSVEEERDGAFPP